jgi:hypothetical protein
LKVSSCASNTPQANEFRTTSAIRFICQKNGIQILSYLDDLAGCEEEHYCNFAFDFLGKLLQDCGIEESVDKACLPSTRMIFIGILFDSSINEK